MAGKLQTLLVLFVLAFILSPAVVRAQEVPLYESRAVWFATVLGDGAWPVSTSDSASKQAADLRNRIQVAHSLGLNTFIMQVVARGDAMYESERLPWSMRLKGPGEHPGYDPLVVAIDEAHRLGMELHAWFNVFRVGDLTNIGGFSGVSDPGHVYYENPDWVEDRSGALWLNPAYADARAWLVDNVKEIVDKYDVDGIHFDFARYDQGGYINDLDDFNLDPRGFTSIADWRRDNVTLFIREASAAILASKNWVKISAAPIGNYTPFEDAWPALWGFDDVFQESRIWLTDGDLDYLAPQLYFSIGREPEPGNNYDSPDFGYLADEWVNAAQGRPVFTGHGPYKSVVLSELDTQVNRSRSEGARGQVYFRYDHIRLYDFSSSYPTRALPWPMSHRFFAQAPSVPDGVVLSAGGSGGDIEYTLSWQGSSGHALDPLGTYAIFRNELADPEVDNPNHLLAVVPGDSTSYTDVDVQPGTEYRYAIASNSRLGITSDASMTVGTSSVGIVDGPATVATMIIESIYPNPAGSEITIRYASDGSDVVQFRIFDVIGREVKATSATAFGAGGYDQKMDVDNLPTGTYFLEASTANGRAIRNFVKL